MGPTLPKPRFILENLFRFTATVFVSFPRTTWALVGRLRHKLDSPFYFFPVLIGTSRFNKKQAFRMPVPGVQRISSFLELRMMTSKRTPHILQKLIGQIVRRLCKSRNNFNAFIQLKMKFTDTDNFPHPNLGMVIAEMSPHSGGGCAI